MQKEEDNVYSSKMTKIKLKEKYGDSVRFVSREGRKDTILFGYVGSTLTKSWYDQQKSGQCDEAERLIKATAQILKGAIRNYKYETMEITTKGMTTAKNHLISLMTPIYFTNHQKRQLIDFLKKYRCIIYVKSYLKCEFKKFALE